MGIVTNLYHRLKVVWSQFTLHEVSGSFGDLGTFVPLFVALGRERAIHVAPALFLAGLSNLLTGFLWDVPMCVQPMHAIAGLAIVQGLTRQQVTAAGMWMGALLVTLGATSGIECVNRIVPKSVVAGVQLGVGINLAIKGIILMLPLSFWSDPDCILMAIFAGLGTLYALRPRSDGHSMPSPVGLYLLFLAAVIALVKLAINGFPSTENREGWSWEPVLTWTLFDLSAKDWEVGFWEGAVPQLPLTTLNSVISVCALAHTLFPEKRQETGGDEENEDGMVVECLDSVLSRREVAFSVGIMNLWACPFGGLPSCHGAGGLAGQHKLGARHGTAIVFLGTVKMILALTLGNAVLRMLDAFPLSVLGVLLIMAGHELGSTGWKLTMHSGPLETLTSTSIEPRTSDEPSAETVASQRAELQERMSVALLTAIVILGTKKTHFGALAGFVGDLVYKAGHRMNQWNSSWRSGHVAVQSTESQPMTVASS